MRTFMEWSDFFVEFMREPDVVGAIAPSAAPLAERMLEGTEVDFARHVVEYGPGTGVFTEAVLSRLPRDGEYLGIERNRRLADHMQDRFPTARIVHGSCEDVEAHLGAAAIGKVDVVLSGLPWAMFRPELQDAILDATTRVLRPGGTFSTFAYLHGLYTPAGRRFRRRLERAFGRVNVSPVVWANLPPAIVYRCRMPMGAH